MKSYFERYKSWHSHDESHGTGWIIALTSALIVVILLAIGVCLAMFSKVADVMKARPYDEAVKEGYDGTKIEYVSALISEQMSTGESAYEIAVRKGYEGTESDWLRSLTGQDGVSGADGKSAYDLAVENGFEGTLSEWLDSLVGKDGLAGEMGAIGKDGKSAYDLAVDNGYKGSVTEWLVSLSGKDGTNGKNGKSAYELAKENGYEGGLAEWLKSITGKDGEDGKSAYEIAVENGYKGTENQWLASLVGRGVASIEKGTSDGLVDTYVITYTDGTTSNFTVTNGKDGEMIIPNTPSVVGSVNITIDDEGYWCVDGESTGVKARGDDGRSITSIEKLSSDGLIDTYVVKYSDDTTSTFTVTNGSVVSITDGNWYINGEDTGIAAEGKTGNGISSVILTGSEGLIDTYTITFTDGTTTTYNVTVAAVWHTGNNPPRNISGARVGDFYIDLITSDVYELTIFGWENITNIRGISVIGVSVEALYDAHGKYFDRYTFKFSDGTQQIVDTYDNQKVHAIAPEEYYVLVSNDPAKIPDIKLKVTSTNSNIYSVPLESFMIMNIHEVNFSTPGTYRAFINYYNVCEYITIHILPEVPVPSPESYISDPVIVWSEQNFGSFLGVKFVAIYDRPGVATRKVPLSDPSVTITKKNGNPVTEADKGQNLTLNVTYEGYTETIDVYWLSDGTTPNSLLLKNARVDSVYYVGETIYFDEANITEDGVVYPELSGYNYLVFDVYTSSFRGKYIREIDFENDRILSIDGEIPFGYDNRPEDNAITDYLLRVSLVPGVTENEYDISNTILVCVNDQSPEDLEQIEATVNFSDLDVMVSSDSVPDVEVTFNLNISPYKITVPLTLDMLVDRDIFKTEGLKTVELSYRYGNSVITGTVYNVYIHDITRVTDASANDDKSIFGTQWSRYFTTNPIAEDMKCTRSSDIVPKIPVTVSYRRSRQSKYVCSWVNGSLQCAYDSPPNYEIETYDIELTVSDIVNLEYLDFSVPGRKKIEFYHNGVLRTVYINFYDVETGIIEKITYKNENYEQQAIPGSIQFDDIGYLYINGLTEELYDRYSGEWHFVADLSTIAIGETVECILGDGRTIQITRNETWINCSFDGGATSETLINYGYSSSAKAFVGYGDPHNSVNKDDVMYAIRKYNSMQIGTVLTIRYYEPTNGILEKQIVVDEAFFDCYDISMFKEGYVGTQSIYFRYEGHYVLAIDIEIQENAERFEEYTTLDEFRNFDGEIVGVWLDTERNLYGFKKQSNSGVTGVNAYYVAENLGDGRVLAYFANCSMVELAEIINNTPETMRFDLNFLYQIGFTAVIVDHNNKTVEHYEDVREYIEVNLKTLLGEGEDYSGIKAYIRIDGNVAELRLVVEGEGTQLIRFYYRAYDEYSIISMNDRAVAEQLMQLYFVYNEHTGYYDAYSGRWGDKYSIDPSVLGEGSEEISALYFSVCDGNILSVTYPEMEPGNSLEVKYVRISKDMIYVPDAGIVVVLDDTTMTAKVYEGQMYDADVDDVITALETLNGSEIYVTGSKLHIGYDMITVYLTMLVGEGVERTFTITYTYYEFADGKYDIRIVDNDLGLSTAEKELINTFYIELVESTVIDEITGLETVSYIAVAKSASSEDGEPSEDNVVKYNIDYSDFYSFPEGLSSSSINDAYITIDPNGSMLSIYINGMQMHTGAYIYDPMVNAFIPEGFYDYEGLMFSFEIVDSDTVKMYDMLPGEQYNLEAEAFFKLMGEEVDIKRAFVRFAANGKCSLYVELQGDDGKLMQIMDYVWYDNETVLLDSGDDDMALYLAVSGSDTFELCYGNEEIKEILFTESGLGFILYRSGVAACDKDFGLAEFCFWTYLDDDTILMTTVLGFGVIFEVKDGILYYDNDFVHNSQLFEDPVTMHPDDSVIITAYKYKNSDKVLLYYSAKDTGSGEQVSGGYLIGERLNDEVYYASYLLFSDMLYNYVDGQCITPPINLD